MLQSAAAPDGNEITMHTESLDLREVMVFLAAAGLAVPVMNRFRVSPVLGFLLVGLAIGPYGLGRLVDAAPWLGLVVFPDVERVRAVADLGVVFLLFTVGLELSLARLVALRRLVFGLGGAQIAVSAVLIGGAAYVFGNSGAAATVIGGGLALSSTAIVMQLLGESGRAASPLGRASLAILLAQDLAVVPLLFLVGVLAAPEAAAGSFADVALAFVAALAKAAATVVVIIAVGRMAIGPLLRMIGASRSRELLTAGVLLVVLGTALLTQAAGMSLALGAFLAGLVLAETAFRHEVEADLEPFKGLLLGLFFISVGMSVDLAAALAMPWKIGFSVIGLFAIKAAVAGGLAILFGLRRDIAAELGLLLGQAGEFAFILFGIAMAGGLLPHDTGQFMLVVTGLGMFATPLVAHLARALAARVAARGAAAGGSGLPLAGHDPGYAEHVVVVGYGRVGRMLGQVLDGEGISHVAIDLDPATVERQAAKGAEVYFGDARQPAILDRVGIGTALALVVTMDDSDAAGSVVRAVRARHPRLPILARARDVAHARGLVAAGANDAVPEALAASLELAAEVLASVGLSEERARDLVMRRRLDLQTQIRSGEED